jgi:membrane dipeptidase
VVSWMRNGRWTKAVDFGEGSADAPGFPAMPNWFQDNRHFGAIERGLQAVGMGAIEAAAIMGGNWQKFFAASLGSKDRPTRLAAQ